MLKWLLITLAWWLLIYGLFIEDRPLRARRDEPAPGTGIWLYLQRQHQRNIQMSILISLILVMDASADLHQDIPAAPTDMSAIAPGPAAVGMPPALKTPPVSALPFSDITEFNEKDSKDQAYLDEMKERYEAWLVTFYYIQKCGQAGKQDFDVIKAALDKELQAHHADSTVQENIISAAIGSYQEMYHDIPCDSSHLSTTKTTYSVYMQRLKAASQPLPAVAPATPAGEKHD